MTNTGGIENPIKTKREFNMMKMAAKRIKNGTQIGGGKDTPMIRNFGCGNCSWRSTPVCPHGLKGLQTHTNRICSQRALYIKELLISANNQVKMFQVEQVVKIKLMLDKMEQEYGEGLDLNRQFGSIQKNMISLLDKMRKQDEGIKFQGEISHTIKEFHDVVETQAKVVDEKDIVQEAQILRETKNDTDKQSNG